LIVVATALSPRPSCSPAPTVSKIHAWLVPASISHCMRRIGRCRKEADMEVTCPPIPAQHAAPRSTYPGWPPDIPGSRHRPRSGCGTVGHRRAGHGQNPATSAHWAVLRPGSGRVFLLLCAEPGVCAPPAFAPLIPASTA